MPWEKSSGDLVRLFEQIVPSRPNVEHRKMFGCNCAFVNGNLFTGLFQQSMTFRLSPADEAAFLDQPHTGPFEPMKGHKMKGYVVHRDPFGAGDDLLANWMKCSLEYASKLPPKEKSAKKAAKKKAPGASKKAPAASKKVPGAKNKKT